MSQHPLLVVTSKRITNKRLFELMLPYYTPFGEEPPSDKECKTDGFCLRSLGNKRIACKVSELPEQFENFWQGFGLLIGSEWIANWDDSVNTKARDSKWLKYLKRNHPEDWAAFVACHT